MADSQKGRKSRVGLDTALKIVKIGTTLVATWPLPPDASRATVLRRDIYWWCIMAHNILGFGFMVYDIIRSLNHDIEHAIAVFEELGALTTVITIMIISKVEEPRFQGLIGELQSFMKHANQEELDLIQSYVERLLPLHGAVLASTTVGPIMFALTPTVTKEILPLESQYPYPVEVESFWVWAATYLSQLMIIGVVGSLVIFDHTIWILLWYTSARIELLSMELGRATTPEDVKRCILLHHYLLGYLDRLRVIARIFAFQVTVVAMLLITSGGIVLIRCSSTAAAVLVTKFIFLEVSTMRFFLYNWPCDHIMDMGEKIGVACFGCDWTGKSPAMTKNLLFIMQKAHYPMIIDVPGIVPAMNLEFFSTMMKVSFSYITTLFAVLD